MSVELVLALRTKRSSIKLMARSEEGGVGRGGIFNVRSRDSEACLARFERSMAVSLVVPSWGSYDCQR